MSNLQKPVLLQKPNAPLIFGLSMTLLEFVFANTQLFSFFRLLAFGGLFTWAWLEVFQGVNWIRRALGFAVICLLMYDKLTNGI